MKKLLILLMLFIGSLTLNAQVNFMGIPVDGTKNEMINKIRKKGFIDSSSTFIVENKEVPVLTGTFNGKASNIYIVTNKGKVYRIYVAYKNSVDKAQIITDFNNLYNQFLNSYKYLLIEGTEIQRTENISYEMHCNNKQYHAVFYQINDTNLESLNMVWFSIEEYYGEYYIALYYDNLLNKANGEDL